MMQKKIPLVTSNLGKYALFQPILERLGVEMVPPPDGGVVIPSDEGVALV